MVRKRIDMFASLLLSRLNAALSSVFEEIERRQLHVSILAGEVCLENLRLKKNVISPFSLPLEVSYGCIRSLRLKVGLSSRSCLVVVLSGNVPFGFEALREDQGSWLALLSNEKERRPSSCLPVQVVAAVGTENSAETKWKALCTSLA